MKLFFFFVFCLALPRLTATVSNKTAASEKWDPTTWSEPQPGPMILRSDFPYLDESKGQFQEMTLRGLKLHHSKHPEFFKMICPHQDLHFFACNYGTDLFCVCSHDKQLVGTQSSCNKIEGKIFDNPQAAVKKFRFRVKLFENVTDSVYESEFLTFLDMNTNLKKDRVFIFRKKCILGYPNHIDIYLSVSYPLKEVVGAPDKPATVPIMTFRKFFTDTPTIQHKSVNETLTFYIHNLAKIMNSSEITIVSIILLTEGIGQGAPHVPERIFYKIQKSDLDVLRGDYEASWAVGIRNFIIRHSVVDGFLMALLSAAIIAVVYKIALLKLKMWAEREEARRDEYDRSELLCIIPPKPPL